MNIDNVNAPANVEGGQDRAADQAYADFEARPVVS